MGRTDGGSPRRDAMVAVAMLRSGRVHPSVEAKFARVHLENLVQLPVTHQDIMDSERAWESSWREHFAPSRMGASESHLG